MGKARDVPYGADPEDRRARTVRSLSLMAPTTGKESMTELNTAARGESARTSYDGRACRSAWPRKRWILDAAYALYADASPRPTMTCVAFLYDIIDALAASADAVSSAPSRKRPSAAAARHHHFLQRAAVRRDCLACRGARLARWTK